MTTSIHNEDQDFPKFDESNHQTIPADAWFN
jgi:hypothetical protein